MFRGRQMVRTARQARSDGPPPSRDEVIAAQEQSVEEPERISFASAVRQVDGDNILPDAVPTSAPDQDAAAKPEPAIEPAPVAPGVEGVHVPTSIELAAAADLYANLVSVTESIFEVAVRNEPLDHAGVFGVLNQCLGSLQVNDDLLTESIRQRELEQTLPVRASNVAVLSLRVGLQLKFEERQTLALGLCSLVHDLGMTTVPDEILSSRKLTPEQLGILRRHPFESRAMMVSFGEQFAWIGDIVAQVHERQDGSGYPEGLSGDDIHEFAQIIGLADTYEAMSHPRPDREAPITYNALTEIIDVRNSLFDPALVKALINIVSIFPLGSLVQLNNRTVGRVIGANRLQPARPLIEVLLGSEGKLLKAPHTVDLIDEPMLHIADPAISESRLTERSARR